MPKMKHPDAKKNIDVRDDQVELYATQGWVLSQPAAKKAEPDSK